VRGNQAERLAALPPGAWPCNTLGNHDSPRVASRYASRRDDPVTIARLALALVLTLRGTPFLYNGEEIGMTDLLLNDLSQFRDTLALWHHRVEVEEFGARPAAAVAAAARLGRDKCRTPLQWANAPNGGFCPPGVRPWLPVNPNYAQGINVADQQDDPDSLLNFYRRLLRLRRATPALRRGDYRALTPRHRDVLLFERSVPEQTCVIALNFSARAHSLPCPTLLRLLYAGHGERALAAGELRLGPHEIVIAEAAEEAP
jgi:alpha-glucosidase